MKSYLGKGYNLKNVFPNCFVFVGQNERLKLYSEANWQVVQLVVLWQRIPLD